MIDTDRILDEVALCVLAALAALMARHGYPPTLKEIASEVGVSCATVSRRLRVLERFGYVVRNRPASRPRMSRCYTVARWPATMPQNRA